MEQKKIKQECRKVVKEILDDERREEHYYSKPMIELMHSMVRDKLLNSNYTQKKIEKGE